MVGESVRQELGGSPANWMPSFTDSLAELAKNDQRDISQAWAHSLLDVRLHNTHFLDLVDRAHHLNPGATPSEMQRRFLSAEQAVVLAAQQDEQLPFDSYPSDAYTNQVLWSRVYQWISKTPGYSNQYYGHVIRSPLTTSVSPRTVGSRFLGAVLSHLIGEEPTWADCGCGDMAGSRRFLLTEQFPYDRVRVRDAAGSLAMSEYKSDIFNAIVDAPNHTRRIVGLDQRDPTQPENIAWSYACSTPEEIRSSTWGDLHDRLIRAHVPPGKLVFRLADYSKRADVNKVVADEGRFDVVRAEFSWYQGSAETRRRKLLNMREVLADYRKLLVVSDFARVVGRAFLAPQDVWREATVFWGNQSGFHPVLRATNGRFQELTVLPQLAKLARGGPYEHEVKGLVGR